MEIQEDVKEYLEPEFFLISNTKNPPKHSSDNALLFTAEYLILRGKDITMPEIIAFCDTIDKCRVAPGLFNRYPNDNGDEAHDDLTGLAAFNSSLAKEIRDYGKKHWGVWNSREPGKWRIESFFYRLPGFSSFLKAASGESLNIFEQFWSSLAFLGNFWETKQETSGRCLLLLHSHVLRGKGRFIDFIINKLEQRMLKMYPNGARDLYTIYFGENHPITKLAPSHFRI